VTRGPGGRSGDGTASRRGRGRLRAARAAPDAAAVDAELLPARAFEEALAQVRVGARETVATLRELYDGFYTEDDARFRRALAALEIDAAEDVFRRHFGSGDQRAVRFEAAAFQATFHEAFVRCRDAGVRLHPNFLALGIFLGCLYDHLESLGLAYDGSPIPW